MTEKIRTIGLYFLGAIATFSCESPPALKNSDLSRENMADSAILEKPASEGRSTVSKFLSSDARSDSFEANAKSYFYHKFNLPSRRHIPGIETALMLHQDSISMLFQKKNGNWIMTDTFRIRFLCIQQHRGGSNYHCSIPELWTEDFNHDGLEDIVLRKAYGFSGRCPYLIFLNRGDGDIRLANPDFNLVEPEYDTLRQLVVSSLTGHSPYYREGTIFRLHRWKLVPFRKITVSSDQASGAAPRYVACLYKGQKNAWVLTQKRTFDSDEPVNAFVEKYWPY